MYKNKIQNKKKHHILWKYWIEMIFITILKKK